MQWRSLLGKAGFMSSNQWIPCSKAMPEHHDFVLVTGIEKTNNVRCYMVMVWDKVRWRPARYTEHITVDAWMEIPKYD